jgi:hypothetical protein
MKLAVLAGGVSEHRLAPADANQQRAVWLSNGGRTDFTGV